MNCCPSLAGHTYFAWGRIGGARKLGARARERGRGKNSLAGHRFFTWGALGARAREKWEGGKYVWCKRTGFCAQKECNYPHMLRNST